MLWIQELELGLHYSIYMKHNITASGLLVKVGKDYLVLLNSLHKKLLVSNLSDVVMVEQVSLKEDLPNRLEEVQKEIVQEVKKTNEELSQKKLKDLQKERRVIERQIIEGRLQDHTVGVFRQANYGIPSFFKKQKSE